MDNQYREALDIIEPFSNRDVVYCDAGFFSESKVAIIGVLYKKELTRVKVKVKGSITAEMMAIIFAKKLYPGRLVVNDCLTVVNAFSKRQANSLQNWTNDHDYNRMMLLAIEFSKSGIIWEKRRSSAEARIVDTATRKELSRNYKRLLKIGGFDLREYGL